MAENLPYSNPISMRLKKLLKNMHPQYLTIRELNDYLVPTSLDSNTQDARRFVIRASLNYWLSTDRVERNENLTGFRWKEGA